METQVNSKQTILNYGLYLGLASVFLSVLIYAMGMSIDQPTWTKALSYIIFIGAVFLGIKKYKELNDNILSIGQALKVGVGIALVGGVISAIYMYVFFSFIDPEIISQMMELSEQKMLDANPDLSEEQIEMSMGYAKMFMSPFAMSTFVLIGSLLVGLIVSLISGLILRKEEHNF